MHDGRGPEAPTPHPKRRWPRIAFGVFLVLSAVLAFLLRLPLPDRSGEARLPGLSRSAEVLFDERAVPHVRAATEADAYRVLGWLHAGDRLFQMELRRRAAEGRLSEVLGEAALPFDVEARRSARRMQAVKDLEALDTSTRGILRAYAEGVNAYIATHPRPIEMSLLGIPAQPWRPEETLAFVRLMFSNLFDAGARERTRLASLRTYGPGVFLSVHDALRARPSSIPEAVLDLLRGAPPTRNPMQQNDGSGSEPGATGGSNAWAVAPARTATGGPLLANDPHLPPEIPGVWYAAHLSSDDGLDVAGLTLAGAPGVIIGHNGRVAWGITLHQADDADHFIERLDAAGSRYLDGSTWRPFGQREEWIAVRDAPATRVSVLETRHGPVRETLAAASGERYALALAWAPDFGPRAHLAAFRLASHASSGEMLRDAWSQYGGTALNVCWASREGRIGLLVAGAIPARRGGDGHFPLPGWDPSFDWDGLIPSSSLPRVEDPPEGFVASANDDWSTAGQHLPYPGDFASGARIGRIREVLASSRGVTVESFRALQNDVVSAYGRIVRDALVALPLDSPRARRALSILKSWSGRVGRRGEARLFHRFLQELTVRTFVPREIAGAPQLPVSYDLLEAMIRGAAGSGLWDDPRTPGAETRESRIEEALEAALTAIESEDGPSPTRWQWDRVHDLRYRHPISRLVGILGPLFDVGPIPLPGDLHTVAVAGFGLRADAPRVTHIVSARLIVDLAEPDRSRLVLPLGQSGQRQDSHDTDQVRAWAAGEDFPFPFTREEVLRQARSRLRLAP